MLTLLARYGKLVIKLMLVTEGIYFSHFRSLKKGRRHRSAQGSEEEAEVEDGDDDQDTLDVSPKIVVIFVILMCGMLLSLYFFYDYLGKYNFEILKKIKDLKRKIENFEIFKKI